MITHGTPPVAEGGWSEFIKDFGIGSLVREGAGFVTLQNGFAPESIRVDARILDVHWTSLTRMPLSI